MTVISVDPDRALAAIHELNAIDGALVGRAALPAPPAISLPPLRLLEVALDVERSRATILALAQRTGEARASLAATNARIMIAAGELDDPRLQEFLLESLRPGGLVGAGAHGLAPLGGGVWSIAKAINDAATGASSALFLALYAHGRKTLWLAGEMPYADFRNGSRALSRFSNMYEDAQKAALKSIPKVGRFSRAFGWAGSALTWADSYGSASGRGPLTKGITATATTILTAHPVGAAMDFVTGGVLTGSVNAIMSLPSVFTGDTATADAFTANATKGTYGPVFQWTAGLGDGIAAAATGDLDSWSNDVGDGKFGTPLKLLHDGENAVIDKLFEIGNPFN